MKKRYFLKLITTIMVVILLSSIYFLYLNNWEVIRSKDIVKLSPEWSDPVWLGINTKGWEDGAYISSNGDTLYFSYYSGDLIYDYKTQKFKDDVDVYYSMRPFEEKKLHPISEDIWSEGGVMFSNGDIYYMSNRNSLAKDNIYKNGKRLDFGNSSKSKKNPHYCSERDEVYFEMDGHIYVYDNESTSPLPFPINDGSSNGDPFLTTDCGKIYFSSNRDGGVSKIYRATRFEENWGKLELVASSKYGVGKPTLTDNGKTMFFVQIFKSPLGRMNADILYTENIVE